MEEETEGVPIEIWQQHFKELYDTKETQNINEYETDTSTTVNGEEVQGGSKVITGCSFAVICVNDKLWFSL